jgi:GntR family transcriptional regulator, transcriptional repressor for pyruvate dehydrogenase complex
VDAATPGRRSDLVHDRLRREVLEGRLAPGDAVPSERVLAEELGVNRHAVREALKRLEQAGLVRITQGGATRVQDWRHSAGLEVLLDLAAGDGGTPPDPRLARAVLEMRESVGVDAARRCAVRASPAERRAVAGLAASAAAAIRGAAPAAVIDEAYATLWRELVVAAENIAYRLALNSLVAALGAHSDLADALRPRDAEGIEALGAAIQAGDAGDAEAAARRLLEPDTHALG